MSIMNTGLKRNLNIRPRKDTDLLTAITKAGFDVENGNGDYSHFCRELMRDGLRFRQLVKSGKLSGEILLPMAEPEEEEVDYEKKYGRIMDEGMLAEGEI